ncbi:MAG TPA: Rieske (2Fe-2S) protein [Amycolatopsis sp.]|nr:Rieske (2Fe-2S) protein [Amycolatopsis sp.]
MSQKSAVPTHTDRQVVGKVDQFPVGEFTMVKVRNREVGVYRSPDGRWFAARNLCPHRGAPLCRGRVGATMLPSAPGELIFGMENEVVRCPWHSLEFSLETGESVFGAAPVSISVYEVTVVGDDLLVSVRPKERARTAAREA